jgi:hypothetical protein
MTDNLRDRIAAVLDKHYPQTTGYQDELSDWCRCGLRRDHVADAVIRDVLTSEFLADLVIQAIQRASDTPTS